MFTRPPDLSDVEIVEALQNGWGFDAVEVAHLPVGFGSHHWRASGRTAQWFVTVDDLDAKLLGDSDTRDAARLRLLAAMESARSLHDSGLDFVAAPITSQQGQVSEAITDRYVLSVFEYLEGETHAFGAYPTRAARLAVLQRLAALHEVPRIAIAALEERFVIPRREVFDHVSDVANWPIAGSVHHGSS